MAYEVLETCSSRARSLIEELAQDSEFTSAELSNRASPGLSLQARPAARDERHTGRAAAVRNISAEQSKWDTPTADTGELAVLLFKDLCPWTLQCGLGPSVDKASLQSREIVSCPLWGPWVIVPCSTFSETQQRTTVSGESHKSNHQFHAERNYSPGMNKRVARWEVTGDMSCEELTIRVSALWLPHVKFSSHCACDKTPSLPSRGPRSLQARVLNGQITRQNDTKFWKERTWFIIRAGSWWQQSRLSIASQRKQWESFRISL